MVHRCPNCPESAILMDYLLEKLFQRDEDDGYEDADEILFQQWTTIDKSELVQQSLPIKSLWRYLWTK